MLGRHSERHIIPTETQSYLPSIETPNNQPRQGRIPVGLPLLLAANIGYSIVLAVRPQWPEDINRFIQASPIGK